MTHQIHVRKHAPTYIIDQDLAFVCSTTRTNKCYHRYAVYTLLLYTCLHTSAYNCLGITEQQMQSSITGASSCNLWAKNFEGI